MNTPSTPLPPLPTASSKVAEDPDYCATCTPLDNDCPGKLGLSSDRDEEDDEAKDKDQKQPEASPDIFIMPMQALKPPKPYITKYFDNMNSDTAIIYTPMEKQRYDTILCSRNTTL